MNIKRLISRALIACDALTRGFMFKPGTHNTKHVIIVMHQAFGDAVVISASLQEYAKIFADYDVIYLARPSVIEFMKAVVPYAESLNFEPVDFARFIGDYAYYREISAKYRDKADILIVPVSSPGAEIFSCANKASRKIASVRPTDITSSLLMRLLSKYAYTEKIRPDKNEMTLQRHRQLINYLGDKDFKARLPRLKSEPGIINEEKYCVMCLGASNSERWWPAERFAQIIDYVNEELNMNVHLCGGKDEAELEKDLHVKYPERVISHAGKTSFSEWSSIVQHASLFIGNDSGTAHLAVAHRVRTVCITGDYEFVIFPYKVDVLEPDDILPLCVYKKMPCENCRDVGYYTGSTNPECMKRIKEGKCALCIDAVSVEDVKNAIKKIMKEEKNIGRFIQ
ncbi:MAG: glycosyltransferase family 9 protein [Synergistaceae bacterium]|nr:glycosyltransferase family 9 protein [Synergistaceae bacterium]MBR0251448.1 glycosyltransferase family 9 protein [Synergistaceae bacterium]